MDRQIELKLGEHSAPLQAHMPVPVGPNARSAAKPKPVKAKPPALTKDTSAEDAFRLTLMQCKWQIASNVPAIVSARDAEGIHQMRVGFRRLRVAFTAFGDDFRNPQMERLKDRAKRLSEKLAPARDLDVFVEELLGPAVKANGKLAGFETLRARACDARRVAWDFAVAHVTGGGFEAFLDDLSHVIDGQFDDRHMAFEMPVVEIARRVLDHRLDRAKERAKHLKSMSANKRHHLRIALKKLRYTAEFFDPLFNGGEGFMKSLSKMQDVLGALNDVAVAKGTLEKLAHGEDDTLSFAAGMVYGWHLDRASHEWKGAKKRWKKLEQAEPFWNN